MYLVRKDWNACDKNENELQLSKEAAAPVASETELRAGEVSRGWQRAQHGFCGRHGRHGWAVGRQCGRHVGAAGAGRSREQLHLLVQQQALCVRRLCGTVARYVSIPSTAPLTGNATLLLQSDAGLFTACFTALKGRQAAVVRAWLKFPSMAQQDLWTGLPLLSLQA